MRFPENDPAYHHWLNQPGSRPEKKDDTYLPCGMSEVQLKAWAVPNKYTGEEYDTQPAPLPFQIIGRN